MSAQDRAVHVMIAGRVQGVGYRMWVEQQAASRALSGWVRNRRDGSVEAVFCGDAGAIERMLLACREGPPAARVSGIEVTETTPPEDDGFAVLPTV